MRRTGLVEGGRYGLVGEKLAHLVFGKRVHAHGNRSRPDSREKRARLARRDDDVRVVGGLLEQFQKCVGRVLGAFLKSHAFRVANDENFSMAYRRSERCLVDERSNRCDVDAFVCRRSGVQSVVCDTIANRLAVIVADVFEGRVSVLESWPGEVPVKVRVCEIEGVMAAFALPAGRGFTLTENGLREPECQALLADSARAVKQKARGESACLKRPCKAFPELLVTEKGGERHSLIWHVS